MQLTAKQIKEKRESKLRHKYRNIEKQKLQQEAKEKRISFTVDEAFMSSYIYFLYKDDVIVYIGETESFMERIAKHFSEAKKDFDRFVVEPFEGSKAQRLHREKLLIHKHKPMYNVQHKTKKEITLVFN